jgi:hypothetical protein
MDISIPNDFKFFWTLVSCLRVALHINKVGKKSNNIAVIYRSFVPAIVQYFLTYLRRDDLFAIFDTDGLPLDEKKQVNLRNISKIKILIAEKIQRIAIKNANAVLTRSTETIEYLKQTYETPIDTEFIKLINGREEDVFNTLDSDVREKYRLELGVADESPILLFTGSIGEQYMFDDFQKLAACFVTEYPKCKVLVATFSSTPYALLRLDALEKEIGDALVVKRLESKEIGKYVAACDLAISFRIQIESMKHVAPLKIREYLLCGVPIVYTDSTGDTVKYPKEISVLYEPGATEPEEIIQWYQTKVERNRELAGITCRNFGVDNFSINIDVDLLVKLFSRYLDLP